MKYTTFRITFALLNPGRAGANSLNFAILIAIPAILTALSHLLLNILAHQGDSQWSRDHTNNPTMRLLHTSKLSFIIVCQWNSESLASLVFGRPICWSWACYFSEIFLAKCWDTPMLFGDRMRSDSVTSSSGTFLQNTKWRHRLVLFFLFKYMMRFIQFKIILLWLSVNKMLYIWRR